MNLLQHQGQVRQAGSTADPVLLKLAAGSELAGFPVNFVLGRATLASQFS